MIIIIIALTHLACPGAMVSMSPSLDLKGTFKFSFRKLAAGADISMSTFTGPGEVILAPIMSGDIEVLQINEGDVWTMNTRAFLGCTQQIERKPMTQSLWKGLFSGAGFVVEKVQGQGLLFVQGYGAIMKVTVGVFFFLFLFYPECRFSMSCLLPSPSC